MTRASHYNQLAEWTDQWLALGRYSFSLSELRAHNPHMTAQAIKFGLRRLVQKGKLVSIFKGYYLILPPQYASKGILPPQLFLDAFMNYLQRPYYLALLNAAAYHGAAHQQPQEFFVMTCFPVLRPTMKKGLKLNYISKKEIPEALIVKAKTEAGYLNISNAALTACDIIQFEKRTGGLNRAATVLNELAEVIYPVDFSPLLLQHVHQSTLQRLGYLLERVCQKQALADALFDAIQREKLSLYRIPLSLSSPRAGFSAESRWKVIVNAEIETDQ